MVTLKSFCLPLTEYLSHAYIFLINMLLFLSPSFFHLQFSTLKSVEPKQFPSVCMCVYIFITISNVIYLLPIF